MKAAQKLAIVVLCCVKIFALQTDFIVHCEYRYRCLLIYVSINGISSLKVHVINFSLTIECVEPILKRHCLLFLVLFHQINEYLCIVWSELPNIYCDQRTVNVICIRHHNSAPLLSEQNNAKLYRLM